MTPFSTPLLRFRRSSSSSSSASSLALFTVVAATLLAVLAALVPVAEATPALSPRHFFRQSTENRINRRGFKSSLLSTARGFGKRSGGGLAEREVAVPAGDNSPIALMGRADVPAYALADEVDGNPRLLALLVSLLDANGDGVISPHEVLRDI